MTDSSQRSAQYNTADQVFAAQGVQNIYIQKLEDYFRDGLEALKNRLYPIAVQRFEEYLVTATSLPGSNSLQISQNGDASQSQVEAVISLSKLTSASSDEIRARMGKANVYAALALLRGTAPSYHPPEVIRRIDVHLENARKVGTGQPVYALANVLWAVVKDDWYDYQGMPAPDPQASELRHSIADLDHEDLGTLVEHLAPAKGLTWKQLADRAKDAGFAVPDTAEDGARRGVSPERQKAVKKYFTDTPDKVNPAFHVAAFSGAGLLVLLGIITGNIVGFIFLAGISIWPTKWGVGRLQIYRKYLKDLDAAEPKPSDQQMDEWLREDVEYIKRKATCRLRLNAKLQRDGGDLVVPEQVIVGIPQPHERRADRIRVRVGKDQQLRADHLTVLVLFLTDKMISTYRCVVDFATSDPILDETREYHYADIVGVSSSSIPMGGPLLQIVELVSQADADVSLAHQFGLSITSGESLQVVTGFGGRFETAGDKVVWRGNENALRIIQTMVRSRHAR